MSIYKAITGVMSDLSKQGISKNQTNTFDRYKFRGIDDVYNALSPLMAKHGVCIFPRVLSRESVERESKKGDAMFYVTVDVEFDFVAAEDGSKHTVKAFGEAMDRSDKATNKAMSAAYKYAMFQVFCIPTEAQDADAETHELKARPHPASKEGKAIKQAARESHPLAGQFTVWLSSGEIDTAREAWDELDEDGKRALWSVLNMVEKETVRNFRSSAA